jgi:hypothetical protein
MSGAVDAIGDVVGGVLDTAGDIVSEAGNFVGDVVSEIDFEDALQTYIQTGSIEAAIWAATPGDEKIGYDYGVKGGSDSGGSVQPTYTFEESSDQPFQVGFAPGESGGMPDQPYDPNQESLYDIFGDVATNVVNKLRADNQPAQVAQNVIGSMSGILADVAAGKFSKSPASEYNTRSVLKSYYEGADNTLSSGLLNDYATAKRKVAEMVETPSSVFGEVALQGNPFYNFMQQRNIGQQQQMGQSNLFEPYLQQQGIV